ncbi:RsmD family RNA methyltransferase [uncultured Methanoregula sp.]|uniref:class I SAM-dependent methyltransferase n=1 Tax=uncultured Methanoregula sp. TaxID=1005933 RepID=UPI002AAC441F|nr:RsmD family RNA methyltransferase [uncultured Methanoregula sp.]
MGFKDQLSGRIPGNLLHFLNGRYDMIGSIAVISIPRELDEFKYLVAEALVSYHHSVKTVLNKIAPVDGNSRIARYEILAGKETVTTCREYGFEYRIDVLSSFFNPRLCTERKRVAGQVLPGEQVLVPFAGVGPFIVPAAARGARVVAIEQNPDAFRWLVENIRTNRVDERVTAIMGDAFDTSLLPLPAFDRVIIPTPFGMDTILESLETCVKPGGMIHFYTFRNKRQVFDIRDGLERRGYDVKLARRCGNVAPGISRWVFDLKSGS